MEAAKSHPTIFFRPTPPPGPNKLSDQPITDPSDGVQQGL